MKKLLLLLLLPLVTFGQPVNPIISGGTGTGGGGGSATNIGVSTSGGLLTTSTNGTGDFTIVLTPAVVGAVTSSNALYAVAATNAVSSTNWGTMESLLNPPHIGVPGTTGNYATAGNNSGFCYISGSGIVRSLWSVPVISLQWTNVPTPQISLQCYVDVGSNTNPPTAALKAFEIPITDLMQFNYRFASNGNYSVAFDSRFLSITDQSTNILMGHPIRTFLVKMPIYYTNGILFRLTNTVSANNTWTNGYFVAAYESGPLTGPYQNFRLRTVRYNGAITAVSSNYLGGAASGSGLLVGSIQSAIAAQNTGDFVGFMDSHGYRITQGASFWENNGDDLYNSTYAMVRGQYAELDYGSPNVLFDPLVRPTLTYAAESYRWFYQDHMFYTNGFVASVTPNGALANYRWNLFYYAQ